MTDTTAAPAEPADLPAALIELRHARAEAERLRHFVEMADAAGRETERLEQQIGRVRDLHREEYGCCEHCTGLYGVPYPCPTILALADEPGSDAASVVVPAADRAAVYREVAAECDKAGGAYGQRGANDAAGAAFALMETFLRKAAEAEYVAAPCSVGGCEPGGEPCSTHERLMAHAEGDHELCAPDCGGAVDRVAAETPPAEGEPTESVIYEVVGDWGVDSADSAEGARAAVAKWLREYPKCGAYAQQRTVREWPDGSEFYGPWTDLPDGPVVEAQPGKDTETREADHG